MLVLTQKRGRRIVIQSGQKRIELYWTPNANRIGIQADRDVRVWREDVEKAEPGAEAAGGSATVPRS